MLRPYGREVVLGMIKLLKDKSEEVKAAAYKGLAAASILRYPEAQETLVRAARTKNTPLAERLLAIEGLGKAVKLQFLGNFEDKLAIWTLVLLLDDEEQKVREAAFAQMDKLVKDEIEARLNELTAMSVETRPMWITDAELDARPELVRTMSVAPPRGEGRVRLLEIPGIDLQACGGTHVRNINEVGRLAVARIRSEGKRNKRVTLTFA